jgi:hypothetical protein
MYVCMYIYIPPGLTPGTLLSHTVYWCVVLYVLPNLTQKESVVFLHTVFLCSIPTFQQKRHFFLYNIQRLSLLTEERCILCEVRNEYLYIIRINFCLKGLMGRTRPKIQTNVLAYGKKIGPDNAQQAGTL